MGSPPRSIGCTRRSTILNPRWIRSRSSGDIHARTTSTSRGPVDVQASVGDAHLTLAGRTIVSPREPGPGHRVRLTDEGPDAVTVKVGVGTASVDIK